MQKITDLGKQGIEVLGEAPVVPESPIEKTPFKQLIEKLERFKVVSIPVEKETGVKEAVEVHTLNLSNPRAFQLVHYAAAYRPTVYAQIGGRRVMGMLSPNYDPHGEHRLPSLKILPLQVAHPLTSSGLPNPEMATMLAGGAGAEGKGIGSDEGTVGGDFEHRLTSFGSISLGDPSIASHHQNHGVRKKSSVVTGLSNGSLGNVFEPNKSVSEFTGFAMPVVLDPGKATIDDELYIPKSFLATPEESFGIYMPDTERVLLGAGLQILYGRSSPEAVNTQIRELAAMQQATVDRGDLV